MSIPATTNRSSLHKDIANRIDTAIPFRNAYVFENTSGAGVLRNRFFVQPRLTSPRSGREQSAGCNFGAEFLLYDGSGTETSRLAHALGDGNPQGTRPLHEWEGELMTEEEKRLAERVSILRGLLPPFACAIYNGQAHDWDRETVLSMLTGGDGRNGEDPPSRLTEDDVRAYIDKLLA